MKNTKENKQRFFAHYWGQDVLCDYFFESKAIDMTLDDIESDCTETSHILLTSLADITDEHAIEVARICYNNPSIAQEVKIGRHVLWYFFEVGASALNKNWTNDIDREYGSLKMIDVTDYLRSKSYALPFDGSSVEELKEYGWLKIKEQ
jgi:hypothetical protein